MRTTRIVNVAIRFLLVPMFLTAQVKPTVQLAGLRIAGPGSGLNGTELRAFHEQSGTTLSLLIRTPENKKIVEVDDDKCSLIELTDDKGLNLLDGVDWGGFPGISEDGRSALIEVSSKLRPSRDAARIHAKGTIRMRTASSMVTEKIEALKLKLGTEVHVRNETIQVMKAQTEDDGLTLVLQIGRDFMNDMKDIRFFTTSGDPVEIWGRGSFTFGNASQVEYNCDISTVPEALRVEIDLWQDLDVLDVPFEIKSGLGLQD